MAEGAQSGGRFTLGGWLTPNKAIGLEGSYFFLGNHSFPIAYGQEDSSPAGSPPGTYSSYQSSSLQGAEVNLLSNFYHSSRFNLDILGGFRYLRLNESLWVEQDFNSADYSEEDTWNDEFHTCNQFYGGQIGARASYTYDRFFVDLCGKVALGVTHQEVSMNGNLTQAFYTDGTDNWGNPVQYVQVGQTLNHGLLAQPAVYSRNRFTVVPELGINVGYQFTNYIRASLGYSFMYWSSVARPGDQVFGVPGASSFWAQGLNCSLGLNF